MIRGWDDIGYNFLVGGDGKAYVGRGWDRVGAHTLGYNNKSIAICLLGNFMDVEPSQAMLQTAQSLIRCGEDLKQVNRTREIHGHKDQNCTLCPGDKLYAIIKKWQGFVEGPLPGYYCKAR